MGRGGLGIPESSVVMSDASLAHRIASKRAVLVVDEAIMDFVRELLACKPCSNLLAGEGLHTLGCSEPSVEAERPSQRRQREPR